MSNSAGRRSRLGTNSVTYPEYHEQVASWLAKQFPEFVTDGVPHPAAFVMVTHLHQRYGKGSLTRRVHGPAICDAVKRFEEESCAG